MGVAIGQVTGLLSFVACTGHIVFLEIAHFSFCTGNGILCCFGIDYDINERLTFGVAVLKSYANFCLTNDFSCFKFESEMSGTVIFRFGKRHI